MENIGVLVIITGTSLNVLHRLKVGREPTILLMVVSALELNIRLKITILLGRSSTTWSCGIDVYLLSVVVVRGEASLTEFVHHAVSNAEDPGRVIRSLIML